jgi:hypothetical protein
MENKTLSGLFVSACLFFTACKDKNFDRSQQTKTPTKEVVNDTPLYVVIGKPFRPTESQIIAKKYGFQFDYLGCIMTDENEKLQKEQNAKTEKMLKAKFGNNFWDKFNKDLDSLGKTQDKLDAITDLVARQEVVYNKRIQIEHSSNFKRIVLFSTTLKDTAKNTYLVKVSENVGQNEKVYFNYWVNANTMKIISSNKL